MVRQVGSRVQECYGPQEPAGEPVTACSCWTVAAEVEGEPVAADLFEQAELDLSSSAVAVEPFAPKDLLVVADAEGLQTR